MATRKWGTERLVNTITTGNQMNADVAALTGGGFVIVWEDYSGADPVIRAQRFDALGTKVGGEILVAALAGNDLTEPTVTGLADGSFYVGYREEDGPGDFDIKGKVYDASGNFVRNQSGVPFDPDDNAHPDVAQFGTGSMAVWANRSSIGIEARAFDAAGNASNIFRVNDTRNLTEEDNPALAILPVTGSPRTSKNVVFVWEEINGSNRDIEGKVFSGTLNPGFQFQVNIESTPSGPCFAPTVAWLNPDVFVVAWVELYPTSVVDPDVAIVARIFRRLIDFTGTPDFLPSSGNILVNSTTSNDQESPVITALPNGGFVVSWLDRSEIGVDNSGISIRLQVFDGVGGKIGGELVVNTTTTGDQTLPSVAALADGRIAVSWTNSSIISGDTSGSAVRMQIVDPRDGIVSGTGASETLYGHDLVNDEISAGGGNDLLLGLKGDDALYGGDGNDVLRGGLGGDYHDGGTGTDAATYSDSVGSVSVNLSSGVGSGGFATGDDYVGIESVTGSNFADILIGNAVSNSLSGGAGNDTLRGGLGNDILIGNLGRDTSTGGGGNDIFRYLAITHSPVGAGADVIRDFDDIANDRIDVSALFGPAMTYRHNLAFTAAGQVRINDVVGADALVEVNVGGTLAPDLAIRLTTTTLASMTASDFVL